MWPLFPFWGSRNKKTRVSPEQETRAEFEEQMAYVRACAEKADPKYTAFIATLMRKQIVTAEIFRRSSKQVLIQVDRLDPRVFGTKFVLDAVEVFLTKSQPNGNVSIIVYEPVIAPEGSLLAELLASPRVCMTVEPVSIRQGMRCQFMVGDEQSYWYEKSLRDVGLFAFGDIGFSKKLTNFFRALDTAAYHKV